MRKVYVVGFDGATWRFIRPLVERGEMPNFQRLIAEGVSGDLKSVIPFQSAAAWVTFMTGKNSGKHGVYMFQDYDALSYTYAGRTANSRYFSGQTIFDIVGEMGGTVSAIRVPMTYPAWPINGVMVSGFPTPGRHPGVILSVRVAVRGRVGRSTRRGPRLSQVNGRAAGSQS